MKKIIILSKLLTLIISFNNYGQFLDSFNFDGIKLNSDLFKINFNS